MVYEIFCTEELFFSRYYATWQAQIFSSVCLVGKFLASNRSLMFVAVKLVKGLNKFYV